MYGKHVSRPMFRIFPLLTVVAVIASTQKHPQPQPAAHPPPALAAPAATPASSAAPQQSSRPKPHDRIRHLSSQHLLAATLGHAGPNPRTHPTVR